jgi:hypothetical protein
MLLVEQPTVPNVYGLVLVAMDDQHLASNGLDLVDVRVEIRLRGRYGFALLLQPQDQRGQWSLQNHSSDATNYGYIGTSIIAMQVRQWVHCQG